MLMTANEPDLTPAEHPASRRMLSTSEARAAVVGAVLSLVLGLLAAWLGLVPLPGDAVVEGSASFEAAGTIFLLTMAFLLAIGGIRAFVPGTNAAVAMQSLTGVGFLLLSGVVLAIGAGGVNRSTPTPNLGCVSVEAADGQILAVGRLSLSSDIDGSIDFGDCGTTAPKPGTYRLLIRGELLDVLLIGIPISSFGSLSEERQNVRLLEPYTGPR